MSSSLQADPILVSYHDSIVRRSNLRTLDNANWLDDNIITFAFEYLQYEPEFAQCHHLFQFVTPPVVQLLKMTDDSFAEGLLQSIDFLGKQYLVLPINDNTQRTTIGGSHWSLLILSIAEKSLYHFDSMSSANDRTAREIQRKFRSFFHHDVPLHQSLCPQQKNGFDCGLYVIAIVDEFCRFVPGPHTSPQVNDDVHDAKAMWKNFADHLHRRITSDSINQRRQQLKSLLERMSVDTQSESSRSASYL